MAAESEGLVIRSTAGFIDVWIGGSVVQCRMRGRLKKEPRSTDLCVIGDRVLVSARDDDTHVVETVLARRSRFSRRQPGRGPPKEDVLVANLDQLMVTFCFDRPRFNARLLDRFLVIAEHQGIRPIVVMNKSDLRTEGELGWRAVYDALGYSILLVSAVTREGMEELKLTLRKKVSAFVGPSGVGKSSLINRLIPDLDVRVADVSDQHGKGRHTTRVATLYPLDGGGFLADTPGIRELGAWALPVGNLDRHFPELAARRAECAFRGCTHVHEPNCAVRTAVDRGEVDPNRYESYLRIRETTV